MSIKKIIQSIKELLILKINSILSLFLYLIYFMILKLKKKKKYFTLIHWEKYNLEQRYYFHFFFFVLFSFSNFPKENYRRKKTYL